MELTIGIFAVIGAGTVYLCMGIVVYSLVVLVADKAKDWIIGVSGRRELLACLFWPFFLAAVLVLQLHPHFRGSAPTPRVYSSKWL